MNSLSNSFVAYDNIVGEIDEPYSVFVLIQKHAVMASKGFSELAVYQRNRGRHIVNVQKEMRFDQKTYLFHSGVGTFIQAAHFT